MRMRAVLPIVALAIISTLGCVNTPLNRLDPLKFTADAESFVKDDPVFTYLMYRDLAGIKNININAEQRQGLYARMSEIKPLATARLSEDYQEAIAKGSARDLMLFRLIRMYLEIKDQQPPPDFVKKFLLRTKEGSKQLIWNVSDVVTVKLGSTYSDNRINQRITVSAGSGIIAQVKVRVTNVSDSGDFRYFAWSSGESPFGLINHREFWLKEIGETGRWLHDSHITLSVNGTPINCIYFGNENYFPSSGGFSGFMPTFSTLKDGKQIAGFHNALIPKGKSVSLDMLFPVPSTIKSAELRILGAQPISVAF